MPPLFRWDAFQLHQGSAENSFELLCAILAERDCRFVGTAGSRFIRNGRPDGGCECYWERADGSTHGYQAKYHRAALGKSQWAGLEASIRKALATYPTMTSMTVCFPQDLSHSPRKGTTTSRQSWEKWREVWEKEGKSTRHSFTVDNWGESKIAEQLAEPRNTGLLRFFFDAACLVPAETAKHIAEQTARVGPRYQPALHVGNTLELLFDWLTMTETFRATLAASLIEVRNLIQRPELSVLVPADSDASKTFGPSRACVDRAIAEMRMSPTPMLSDSLRELDDALDTAIFSSLYKHDPDGNSETRRLPEQERYKKREAWRRLSAVTDAIADRGSFLTREFGQYVHASDTRLVAISGSGGCGKTHLLCEMAQRISKRGHPVVLLLGQSLNAKQWWRDSYSGGVSARASLLDSLNTAGAISGCRGLLMIDALNEAEEVGAWESEIRGLAASLNSYPHVSVIVTVRDSYADYLLPPRKNCPSLVRMEHSGFEEQSGKALRVYCDHYNIAVPDVPALHPEFGNPLFLSMFCQAIAADPDPSHTRPAVQFPGGHLGFGDVFDHFISAKQRALVQRLDLDLDISSAPLKDTITALAHQAAMQPSLELSSEKAASIAAKHLRGTKLTGNVLRLLEAEGLILRSPKWRRGKRMGESVRLAYDRMHSHFIVSDWLGGSPSAAAALKLFERKGALRRLVEDRGDWSMIASICEELALQWPARYGVELFDSRPILAGDPFWTRTFLRALRSAAPSAWNASTAEWLRRSLGALDRDRDERARYVVRLMARIGHQALITEIHNYLLAHPLAVRDSWWTIPLSERFNDEHENQLVMWPLEHNTIRLDAVQAQSYATALSWLTAVTRRSLRALATKALAAVVGSVLEVGTALLRRFKNVNDPYVLQSVCLAVYGACLRSSDDRAVSTIAQCVVELWPNKDSWPLDIISRHSLAGIVELTTHRNPASTFDLRAVTPPYKSKWVSSVLSWTDIERREVESDDKKLYGLSNVIRSCIPEGGRTRAPQRSYGDFGRYVVDSAVNGFLPHHSGECNPPKPAFAHDLPHRYIISRVLELGWTPELFNEFDQSRGSGDRSRNSVERIGKKYQWIALAEFLARASDRFPIYSSDWPKPSPRDYRDPGDVNQRFLADTSLIYIASSRNDVQIAADRVNKSTPGSLWDEPDDDLWLLSPQGIPDPASFLLPSLNDAVLLRGRFSWQQDHAEVRAESDRWYRRVSMSIAGYAIRRKDLGALDRWMRNNKANNEPGPHTYRDSLFGELYWSRSARAASIAMVDTPDDAWKRKEMGYREIPVPMIPLAAEYSNESDDSREESLNGLLPSRWLAERLALRSGPEEFRFTDDTSAAVCWQVADPASNAAYAQRGRLSSLLDREELILVWWVRGEKMAIDRDYNRNGPIVPFLQGCYWMERDQLMGWSGVAFDEEFRAGRDRVYPPPFVLTPVWNTPMPPVYGSLDRLTR